MSDKQQWEMVLDNDDHRWTDATYRLKVEGGWLYKHGKAITFVPEEKKAGEVQYLVEDDAEERWRQFQVP